MPQWARKPKPVNYQILTGNALDVLSGLADESVHCCVTSPPYWGLRDYNMEGQLGVEATPDEYVANIVAVLQEVKRVLRSDGILWLNLGDSYTSTGGGGAPRMKELHQDYNNRIQKAHKSLSPASKNVAGLKPKNLVGIPWKVAFALQADGWYLRQDIIWQKPNAMPEPVQDRCTRSHEYMFLLSRFKQYYFDKTIMDEPSVKFQKTGPRKRTRLNDLRNDQDKAMGGSQCQVTETRNRRSVWRVNTQPFKGAHFATFPPALIEPCILAGCPKDGLVLDPFCRSGTTGVVSLAHGRRFVGIELNPEYVEMAESRIVASLQ